MSLPQSFHALSHSQDFTGAQALPGPGHTTALPLTWMGRAWWQRLACMIIPCAVLWGLIAWAVILP
ncbi:hypothetical protein EDC15_108123 [Acetobacter aceti NBRC 14818]|uniref:Uncharacterized protein n=1 Tax=Acetobacter aceti NBRC 14818 TaxID=887700 RepID=A0AB33IFF6_ACEAC|nr:hypothetical protein [Acetobacter aceti]TCS33238.1 hypothetical protein EDC15_108123 [Acetobacter aceti NBRC 14818]BCK75698.1 hypothetical protein EMQ_1304 [Acetobacter aceti NBRC 14818]GAN57877.1 hypothetical protein Abac_022_010 [Acetobacter aceti NBRC 14818]